MCAWEWFGDFWSQNIFTLLWGVLYIVIFALNIYLVKISPDYLQGFIIRWWHYLLSFIFFLLGTLLGGKIVLKF
jgi:hypothetical protein